MERSCENCTYFKEPSNSIICLECGSGSNWEPARSNWRPADSYIAFLDKQENKIDVVNDIGVPATLELCAEEAVELAHAALKMARKLRGENPTPKSMDDILEALTEELGDVQINIDKILEYGIVSKTDVDAVKEFKRKRWEERLREKKKQMAEGCKND